MTDRELQEYILKRLDNLADGQSELRETVAGLRATAGWWGMLGGAVLSGLIALMTSMFKPHNN